jgi:hypothetical protein
MPISVDFLILFLDYQESMIHIGARDVPVYMSIQSAVHDKDLLQLRGQDIFLPLSSRYLELPSIHAHSSHFRQVIEHSQVEESTFYEVDVQAAK